MKLKLARQLQKKEKHYNSECKNPALVFAKDRNTNDMRKREGGLKAVGTCKYLQGLLASNNHEPFEHQEFLEELPSRKEFANANFTVNVQC